jgi:hypothetical protein
MARSDVDARRSPRWLGPWGDDLVHEAEVSARLEVLQAPLMAASRVDGPVAVPSVARRGAVSRFRVRLGHMLVAFGGFVEGQADCTDAAAPRTA